MNKLIKRIHLTILRFYNPHTRRVLTGALLLTIMGGLGLTLWQMKSANDLLLFELDSSQTAASELSEIAKKYEAIKDDDQFKINEQLVATMSSMTKSFDDAGSLFEQRSDLIRQGIKIDELDLSFAKFLSLLGEQSYASASGMMTELSQQMNKLVVAKVAVVAPIKSAPENNTLPGDGYSRQTVATSKGNFVVSLVVATGARVVVDAASEGDCGSNCATLPLSEYVSGNNAFAGINGSYFCPPDYARCQERINSFDTLVFNGRTKTAYNQANNVYSVVPLMVAYGSNLNFYRRTLEWSVDSSSTGAVANHPLLLQGGSIAFDEGGLEAYQRDSKGTRGFIGTRGGTIVIGHVYGATIPDAAEVLLTLGLDNALNLDGGGSSALWYGGYKVGPGRALPNAILLVK